MKLNNNYPVSTKELRLLYQVSQVTWRKWLKPLCLPRNIKVYNPHQVQKILTHLGEP